MRAVPHTIPANVYELLSSYWQSLNMGNAWSTGNIKYLLKKNQFRYHLAWRESYFDSARKRNEILSKFSGDIQASANTLNIPKEEIDHLIQTNSDLSTANYYSGRSKDQIKAKGITLSKIVNGDDHNITEANCIKFVFYNIIGLPWNDYVKESSCIQKLEETYPDLTFKRIESDVYDQYMIDVLLYHRKEMICGIHFKYDGQYNVEILSNDTLIKEKQDAFTSKYEIPIYSVSADLLMENDAPIVKDIHNLMKVN